MTVAIPAGKKAAARANGIVPGSTTSDSTMHQIALDCGRRALCVEIM
jgi:hypothetical protein